MVDEKKDQRLQLLMGAGDITAVDDWRRKQADLPSRSEAIRRLIHAGIAATKA
jgi:hypothetical protein